MSLQLFTPSFTRQRKAIKRFLPECPHKHISKLQINGFYGHQQEVDLLQYLLHNLVSLELLVVAPSKKCGRFVSWVSKPERLWCEERLKSIYEWLHAVLPPTVCLEFWWTFSASNLWCIEVFVVVPFENDYNILGIQGGSKKIIHCTIAQTGENSCSYSIKSIGKSSCAMTVILIVIFGGF